MLRTSNGIEPESPGVKKRDDEEEDGGQLMRVVEKLIVTAAEEDGNNNGKSEQQPAHLRKKECKVVKVDHLRINLPRKRNKHNSLLGDFAFTFCACIL